MSMLWLSAVMPNYSTIKKKIAFVSKKIEKYRNIFSSDKWAVIVL